MRELMLTLALSLFPAYFAFAQCCLSIRTIEIIPKNPNPSDSIYLVANVGTTSLGENLGFQAIDNDSVITVEGCYLVGPATQPDDFTDTINLGIKREEAYLVNFIAHVTPFIDTCSNVAADSMQLQFEVLLTNSRLEEVGSPIFSIYPNPISDGLIQLTSNTNFVQVEVMDSFGRLLRKVSIPPTQHLKLDLAYLESGIYFLSVKDLRGKYSTQKVVKM